MTMLILFQTFLFQSNVLELFIFLYRILTVSNEAQLLSSQQLWHCYIVTIGPLSWFLTTVVVQNLNLSDLDMYTCHLSLGQQASLLAQSLSHILAKIQFSARLASKLWCYITLWRYIMPSYVTSLYHVMM